MGSKTRQITSCWLVGWLCLTSHRQRGLLETAPHLLSLAKDVKLDKYIVPHRELNPGPSHGSPLRYRCATQASCAKRRIKPSNLVTSSIIHTRLALFHSLDNVFCNWNYCQEKMRLKYG